jgi:alpha-galactosidase
LNISGLQYKGLECVVINHEGDEGKIQSSSFENFSQDSLSFSFSNSRIAFDEKIKIKISANKAVTIKSCKIIFSYKFNDALHVFCNGFQSWSHSSTFALNEQFKQPVSPFRELMANYGDYSIIQELNLNNQLYSWTYGYVKLLNKNILLLGSVSEKEGYTLIEWDVPNEQIIVHKDWRGKRIEGEVELYNLFIGLGNESILVNSLFKDMHLPYPKVEPAIGWTSWYYYYTAISEKIILDNLQAFNDLKIPIDYFQIDDGYQTKVGDWLTTKPNFPNGMKPIAEQIRASGIKSGIWLAPYICEKNSKIALDNPDWILKDKNNKPIKIGYNPEWSGWYYALNFYHPGVRTYLEHVFDVVVNDWGYDMVKLDFLFAVAVQPMNGKARGEIMHEAMEFLRKCVGKGKILGCGVPISSAFGTTDYCRIGPDVHLKWDFKVLKWIRNKERPSCINAIQNSIHRRHLNKRAFLNDTDVFILRDNKNSLTFNEKYTQLLANIIFGDLIFTSDNISEYKDEILQLYKSIFPVRNITQIKVEQADKVYKIRFFVKENVYVAYLNLSDEKTRVKLDDGWYFNCINQHLVEGDTLYSLDIHQSVCFHQVDESPYAIVGSKGHFFSGSEVETISLVEDNIELILDEKVLVPLKIYLKIPKSIEVKTINNQPFQLVPKRDFNLAIYESK